MRQTVTVKQAYPANSGKKFGSIVGNDNARFPCPAALVGRFSKGQTYEVEIGEEKWGEEMVRVIKALPAQAGPTPATVGGNGHAPSTDRWFMPFVSNTVAHAIQAGRIESPLDIKMWAAAAKEAAEEL